MDKAHYFISMNVECHLLSVLWILKVGRYLDNNKSRSCSEGMYEHSYGNRLKKDLISEDTDDVTWSTSLFEPYFSQYESWRDFSLESAKERLNDNQDALILSLDFENFFYSVDIRKEDFCSFETLDRDRNKWVSRINTLVFNIMQTYSDKVRIINSNKDLDLGNRVFLPIGFLPSSILSNWILSPFDDAVIRKWNPVYYGRYVDDILIVDKVEKNSDLYKLARSAKETDQITVDHIIEMFLSQNSDEKCSANDDNILILCRNNKNLGISQDVSIDEVCNNDKTYMINPHILKSNNNCIRVQNSKAKLFYFQSGSTRALLNCFQTQIAQNASEFRLMPNLDEVLLHNNYSNIFKLKNDDSPNKLRNVNGVEYDKFSLSKFLGKYRIVSGIISSKEETAFERDLMMIMDERSLIENYNQWERLFEILIVNKKLSLYKKLALKIIKSIKRLDASKCVNGNKGEYFFTGLLQVLLSAICRTSALIWSDDINHILDDIANNLRENELLQSLPAIYESDPFNNRLLYCKTRMVNKYIIPLLIDCAITHLEHYRNDIVLVDLKNMLSRMSSHWIDLSNPYLYYPYTVTPHEASFTLVCNSILDNKSEIDPEEHHKIVNSIYSKWNFPHSSQHNINNPIEEVEVKNGGIPNIPDFTKMSRTVIRNRKKQSIRVAIGNAEISEKDFKAALDKRPNRTYQRYRAFTHMFDEAIKSHVDFLVFPENYLPIEWIPVISRICAKNNLAVVTGIEHIVVSSKSDSVNNPKDIVYNFTATILPYEHNGYKFANTTFHNKVHYSPEEIRQILGHGYQYKQGSIYNIFYWHDVWFPVYCCFELASLSDRSIFKSYADIIVAVEWNNDTTYFGNIIESLCRDLHCYCIQSNSSSPGDSRLLIPAKTEQRDLIRTKGGNNNCILIADLDIAALRDFQVLEYELQKDSKTFKPTPPSFDKLIVKQKREGTLFNQKRHPDG